MVRIEFRKIWQVAVAEGIDYPQWYDYASVVTVVWVSAVSVRCRAYVRARTVMDGVLLKKTISP